jgi:hypothetical protein
VLIAEPSYSPEGGTVIISSPSSAFAKYVTHSVVVMGVRILSYIPEKI